MPGQRSTLLAITLFCSAFSAALCAQTSTTTSTTRSSAPTCDDLSWSARVLAENPDIPAACRGVYERFGELYAKVNIELTRVRGNRLSFRTLHTNGSKSKVRSITVANSWRASIDGTRYRARDLEPGQILSVYVPEDRFALAIHDGDFDTEEDLIDIDDASVIVMPKADSKR